MSEKKQESQEVSRRGFLKYGAAGVVVGAVVGAAGAASYYSGIAPPTTTLTETETVTATVASTATVTPTPTATLGGTFYGSFAPFGPPTDDYVKKIAEDFCAKRGMTLTWDVIDWAEMDKRLLAMFMAGTAPDVFYTYQNLMGQLIERGFMTPLDDYLKGSTDLSKHLLPVALSSGCKWKGKLYGIPLLSGGGMVMYYNKALLDKLNIGYPSEGWTIDEFEKTLVDIRDKSSGKTRGWVVPFGEWPAIQRTFWPIFWNNGGEIVDNVDNPTKITVNSDAGVKTVEWFKRLMDNNSLWKDDLMLTDATETAAFKDGNTVFINEAPFTSTAWVQAPVWQTLGAQYFPIGANGTRYTFAAFDYYSISNTAKNKDLVWQYIENFVLPENAVQYCTPGLFLPPRDDVQLAPISTPGGPYLAMLAKHPEWMKFYPTVLNGTLIFDRIQKDVQKALLGAMSPKDALDDAATYGTEQLKG